MLEVVPSPSSGFRQVLQVIGLDMGPFRWVVRGREKGDRRGELTIDNMAQRGAAVLASGTYRMSRSGLLETKFELLGPDGRTLATGSRHATGILARETVVRVAGENLTLAGGKQRYSVSTASKRTVGTINVDRQGWTLRRIHAYLSLDENELNEGVQVFLFWLCIYPDLSNAGAGS